MKITIRGRVLNVTEVHLLKIKALATNLCSAKRFAYNHFKEHLGDAEFKAQSLDATVASKYELNIRYAKDAIEDARQLKESQVELLDSYIENLETKVLYRKS